MRKALLVIALVGASFAGGAVVNGPGLAWVRKTVLGKAGDGFIALRGDDLVKSDAEPPKSKPEPPSDVPASPLPPLDELPATPARPAEAPKPPVDAPSPPDPAEPPPLIGPKSEPAEAKQESPKTPDASPESPRPEGPAPAPPRTPGRSDPAVSNASLARETDATAAEAPSAAPLNWPDLRRRMKELGVARYWIEGEPSGPARFRCLIPVAGARAVAQHFEAEGEDDLQAADAALRRIALWRATEP